MQTRNACLLMRRFPALICALFALSLTGMQSARAAILNVPSQYNTIQAAVTAAAAGDTVLVADGTYTGVGNHDIDFHGKDLTVTSSGGANVCILDCQSQGRGFYLHSGETAASRIEGFTIQSGTSLYSGGGININSNGTVSNCILSGNKAYNIFLLSEGGVGFTGYGGGLYGGTAINCTFRNNSAAYGGGQYSGTAVNCTFTGNSALNTANLKPNSIGGASYNITAINCLFINNSASTGAGMYTGKAINCTFTGNHNLSDYINSSGDHTVDQSTVTNCIIWNNINPSTGPLSRSGNTITFSDVEGGASGTGNLTVDPGFVNAAAGNYRLLPPSPCIDAGTTTGLFLPATDLDGNPRLMGNAPDMGAYEAQVGLPTIITNLYARNDTSGQNSFRQLHGTTLFHSAAMPMVSELSWKMAATADLFHQGNTDLIWRNDVTGDVGYWDVQDETVVSSGFIRTVADLNWKIVGSADLFHTGNTDLVWYNSATGDITYWDLDGTNLVSYGYIATLTDKNWQIVAIADLFHNGHSDFIWQNTSSGDVVYWEMNGTTQVSSGYIAAVPDRNWKIVGSADLFQQNHTDLLWQHGVTGDVVYWDLTGAVLTGSGYLFTMPDPQMTIHAVR